MHRCAPLRIIFFAYAKAKRDSVYVAPSSAPPARSADSRMQDNKGNDYKILANSTYRLAGKSTVVSSEHLGDPERERLT